MNQPTNQPTVPASFGLADYDHDQHAALVDGVHVDVEVSYDPAAPEVGIFDGRWDAHVMAESAILLSRETWDIAHPGVEPTEESMRTVVELARGWIETVASTHAADVAAEDFREPDCDTAGGYL